MSPISYLDISQLDIEAFKGPYRNILQGYLRDVAFEVPSLEYNPLIEKGVIEFLQSQGFTASEIQRTMPITKWSACISAYTYPFTPLDVRVVIAIFTFLAIALEDLLKDENNLADLKEFHTRLLRGEQQPNTLLRSIVPYIELQREAYGTFISDLITNSLLEFINGCIIERVYDAKLLPTPHTPEFPYYLRLKTGVAEAYAFFAFPLALFPEESFPQFLPAIPGLVRYFDLCNDFLSFYKESIVSDERENYIYNLAKTRNNIPLEALEETGSSLVDCVRHLRKAFAGKPQMRLNIDKVINGYIMYHFIATRYRLSELDIEEVDGVIKEDDLFG